MSDLMESPDMINENKDLNKKFLAIRLNRWDEVYDNFVDAEIGAKRKASYSDGERTVVVQTIAEVSKPVDNMVTTVF